MTSITAGYGTSARATLVPNVNPTLRVLVSPAFVQVAVGIGMALPGNAVDLA
jgi:hypothetical protein